MAKNQNFKSEREFDKHIQKQFKPGMSWENIGEKWFFDRPGTFSDADMFSEKTSPRWIKDLSPFGKEALNEWIACSILEDINELVHHYAKHARR